jgi:hypothetical protein
MTGGLLHAQVIMMNALLCLHFGRTNVICADIRIPIVQFNNVTINFAHPLKESQAITVIIISRSSNSGGFDDLLSVL